MYPFLTLLFDYLYMGFTKTFSKFRPTFFKVFFSKLEKYNSADSEIHSLDENIIIFKFEKWFKNVEIKK